MIRFSGLQGMSDNRSKRKKKTCEWLNVKISKVKVPRPVCSCGLVLLNRLLETIFFTLFKKLKYKVSWTG